MKRQRQFTNDKLRIAYIRLLSTVSWVLLSALCSPLSAQRKETLVTLHHADSLIGSVINGESVRELFGNVRFSQENIIVTCDKATEYLAKKFFVLEGNVQVKEDSLIFWGKRGTYSVEKKIAEGFDGVRLVEGKKQLSAERGTYCVNERKAFFQNNVVASDTEINLNASALTYFRNDKHIIASGSVILSNAEQTLQSYGELLEHYPENKFSRMTGNPKVVEYDTASDGSIDTLIIYADTLEAMQDSLEHLWAKKNVKVERESLSAAAGYLEYNRTRDSIVLMQHPYVFYHEHQVSGDTIELLLRKRQLERAIIKEHTLAVSQVDSFYRKRFQQLSGEQMQLYFSEKKLQQIIVKKRATSLYFLFDEDTVYGGKKPNGANKSTGDEVRIVFENGRMKRITVVGGVEGQYFPENIVEGKEEEFRLENFRWIERMKKSVVRSQ
jgi:lipopolysaccharide export system protein LptA